MGFARTATGLLFLSLLGFYLITVGQLTDEAKWSFVVAMSVLAFLWVNLGGQPKKRPVRKPQKPRAEVVSSQDSVAIEEMVEDDEDDLPEPVKAASLDGATLRERKLAKIAAAQAAQAEAVAEDDAQDDIIEVQVELEDVHVAGEYVIDVSPESVEDADIAMTVSDDIFAQSLIEIKNFAANL